MGAICGTNTGRHAKYTHQLLLPACYYCFHTAPCRLAALAFALLGDVLRLLWLDFGGTFECRGI
uniref:Uncharacterized protein n=1 Tax=Arundo donax TaxID=35708 RepID=A0A0A9A813_ARUDO